MIHLLKVNRKMGGIIAFPSITAREEIAKFVAKKGHPNPMSRLLAVILGGPETLVDTDGQLIARRYPNKVTLFRNAPVAGYNSIVTCGVLYYARYLPSYLVEMAGGYDGHQTRNTNQLNAIMGAYKQNLSDWRVNIDLAEQTAKVKMFTEGLGEEVVF